MPESTSPGMTPVDAMLCDDQLQTIKACIPYMRPQEQPVMLLAAKAMEFQQAFRLLRRDRNSLAACSVEPALCTPVHMLNQMKRFCSQNQRDNIDSILNIFQIMQLVQMMQSSPEQEGDSPAWMKAILSPEQQQMFRSFSKTVQQEQKNDQMAQTQQEPGRNEVKDNNVYE